LEICLFFQQSVSLLEYGIFSTLSIRAHNASFHEKPTISLRIYSWGIFTSIASGTVGTSVTAGDLEEPTELDTESQIVFVGIIEDGRIQSQAFFHPVFECQRPSSGKRKGMLVGYIQIIVEIFSQLDGGISQKTRIFRGGGYLELIEIEALCDRVAELRPQGTLYAGLNEFDKPGFGSGPVFIGPALPTAF